MLIHETSPQISSAGCLEFPLPGYGNSVARIFPWSHGFDTFEIKYNKAIRKPLWTLEVFPRQTEPELPRNTHEFISDIPLEIREQVRPFKFGQCAMLGYLARYPQARDLCISNPMLLWLLTSAIFDSNLSEDELPQLLQQKQVEILGRIFKPPSPSALRLLHKIELANGDLGEARTIIRALKKPHIRRIVNHLQSVSTTLLHTLYNNPDLILPAVARILTEAFKEPDCHPRLLSLNISDTLRDIRRMAEALDIGDPDQAIARCRSIGELNRLHDRWVDRVNRDHGLWLNAGQHEWPEDLEPPGWFGLRKDELEFYKGMDWAFPNPPFPDSKEIKAIRSIHELIGEGRLQRNCIASYTTTIMNGGAFVYKVLSPHRATLELIRSDNGWELGQIKLSCNRLPGPEVKNGVLRWLKQQDK